MTKVFLVEDDHTMLTLLSTLLRFEGFVVLQPPEDDHLTSVYEFIQREKPNLVLLDVHLRQFNGLELLKLIRENKDLSSMNVIMSSGMDLRERCLENGASDFILKPYMPDELIRMIHKVAG